MQIFSSSSTFTPETRAVNQLSSPPRQIWRFTLASPLSWTGGFYAWWFAGSNPTNSWWIWLRWRSRLLRRGDARWSRRRGDWVTWRHVSIKTNLLDSGPSPSPLSSPLVGPTWPMFSLVKLEKKPEHGVTAANNWENNRLKTSVYEREEATKLDLKSLVKGEILLGREGWRRKRKRDFPLREKRGSHAWLLAA